MKEKIKSLPWLGDIVMTISDWWRRKRRWLRKYLFYLRHKRYLKPNIELKDRFKGKRAFILACGPSINNQDLSKLVGEFCISVSNFFVHKDFKTIKPEYHVFAESHTPITEEQMTAWLKDAEKHFSQKQKVVMCVSDRILVDKNDIFRKHEPYYYALSESNAKIGKIDFMKRLPAIQTVAHQAIYLALYSGASEIYLLGVDHDTILHLGESRHFYKEQENELHRKGIGEWTHPSWLSHFKAYAHLWEIYLRIADYATRNKIKIFNATPGSLLDVFPQVDLEKILKG